MEMCDSHMQRSLLSYLTLFKRLIMWAKIEFNFICTISLVVTLKVQAMMNLFQSFKTHMQQGTSDPQKKKKHLKNYSTRKRSFVLRILTVLVQILAEFLEIRPKSTGFPYLI